MFARRRARGEQAPDSHIPWVYGAALAAAADEQVAAAATAEALSGDRVREPASEDERRRRLRISAVRLALAMSPAEPFAALAPDEREPIALARLLRLSVSEIAAATECDASVVKARMLNGLRRISDAHGVACS